MRSVGFALVGLLVVTVAVGAVVMWVTYDAGRHTGYWEGWSAACHVYLPPADRELCK